MPHVLLIALLAAAPAPSEDAVKLAASDLIHEERYCAAMQLLLAFHERTGSAEAAYNAGLVALKANDRVRAARLLERVADDEHGGRFRDPSRRYAARIRRLIDSEGPGAACAQAPAGASLAGATPPGATPPAAAVARTPAPPGTTPEQAPAGPAAQPSTAVAAAAGGPGAAVEPPPSAEAEAGHQPADVEGAAIASRTFMARLERDTEDRTAVYAGEQLAAAAPVAPAPTGTRRIVGYSLFAAGGVAILLGGIFTASARSQADALESEAGGVPPPIFDAQRRASLDAFQSNRAAGFAGLAGGALLAGAGAILLLTEPAP